MTSLRDTKHMTEVFELTKSFKDKILKIKDENDINFKSQSTKDILDNQREVRKCIRKEFYKEKLGHPLMYSLGLCCALDKEQIIYCNTTEDLNREIFSTMIDISANSFQQIIENNYYNPENVIIFVKCLCGQNIKNLFKVVLENGSNLIFGCVCILKNKIHLTPEFVIKFKREKTKLKQIKEREKTTLKQIKEKEKRRKEINENNISILSKRYKKYNLELRIEGYNILCN